MVNFQSRGFQKCWFCCCKAFLFKSALNEQTHFWKSKSYKKNKYSLNALYYNKYANFSFPSFVLVSMKEVFFFYFNNHKAHSSLSCLFGGTLSLGTSILISIFCSLSDPRLGVIQGALENTGTHVWIEPWRQDDEWKLLLQHYSGYKAEFFLGTNNTITRKDTLSLI